MFFAALFSVAVLFLLAKLIGNKQLSELNMFDYINSITIGSIAAEMATSLEGDILKPLVAMLVYGTAAWAISLLTNKNLKARRLFMGHSILLYDKGRLYKENFKTAKLDLNEFLAQLRIQGHFALDDVETAILEPNGKISVLPKAQKRPCTPADLALAVPDDRPEVNVIVDGKILYKNLKYTGNNELWLEKQLKDKALRAEEVFLASVDSSNEISFYKKLKKKPQNDIFE